MKLIINDQNIDFTVENEKNLSEIISHVGKWLYNQNFVINTIEADTVAVTQENIHSYTSLDSINELVITTGSLIDVKVQNLTVTLDFFTNLAVAIDTENFDYLISIAGEYQQILDILPLVLCINKNTEDNHISTHLKSLLHKHNDFTLPLSSGDKSYVIKELNNICVLLRDRLNEFQNPDEEAQKTIKSLQTIQEDLENVSVLLQSGEKESAMKTIVRFTELFQKLLRIFELMPRENITIEGEDIESFANELNQILNELVEGFLASDSVLIGDLLEYEISPRIDSLASVFS